MGIRRHFQNVSVALHQGTLKTREINTGLNRRVPIFKSIKLAVMGGVNGRVNPYSEVDRITVSDLQKFSMRAMPVACGPMTCYVEKKRRKIYFYVRCFKNGEVKKKLVFYAKKKANQNFRIYNKYSNKPIGYLKTNDGATYRAYKGRKSYGKLHAHRQKGKQLFCTKMTIPGYPLSLIHI